MARSSRTRGFVAAFVVVAASAACGAGGTRVEETGGVETGYVGESSPSGAGAGAEDTRPDLSDANILAVLDHVHQADSAMASVAATKGTARSVREYARMMITQHHRLRRQGAALTRKLNLILQPPADDPVTALTQQAMEALKSAKRGWAFDHTYIEHEIQAHEVALDLAEWSLRSAGNAELRAIIEETGPLLHAHLIRAREILAALGDAPDSSG
jgi:putative membrane protein